MQINPYRIDWAERWHAQVTAENAQYSALIPPAQQDSDFWGPHAARFRSPRAPEENAPRDEFVAYLLANTAGAASVLDVGSGAGRYAMPLARAGRRIVAVDPSEAMIAALREDAAAEKLPIEAHVTGWESADVAPAEVVICAHVLYSVRDIVPFLRRLDAHAQRQVFVLMGYEPPITWLEPFWRVAYDVDRIRLPGAIDALAVLHQLDIDATLTPLSKRLVIGYESHDAALHSVRGWLRLPPEPARDAALLAELRNQLVPTRNGFKTKFAPRLAVLGWKKNPE